MTSSSEFTRLATPELRTGNLTRLGGTALLGDTVTEVALSALVETARASARSQGYTVGWSEGRRAAAAEASAEAAVRERRLAEQDARAQAATQELVASLEAASRALAAACAEARIQADQHAVDLARELTETVLGRELSRADGEGSSAADLAVRVLAAVPGAATFVLRVHPETAAALGALGADGVPSGARIVADATLAPADAVVEVDDVVMDLRVSTALDRIREALS